MKENEKMQQARSNEDAFSYLMAYSENVVDATLQYVKNGPPQLLFTDDEYNVKIAPDGVVSCTPLNFYAANITKSILSLVTTVGMFSDLVAQRSASQDVADDAFDLAMPIMSLVLSKCKDPQTQHFIEAIFSEGLVKGAKAYLDALKEDEEDEEEAVQKFTIEEMKQHQIQEPLRSEVGASTMYELWKKHVASSREGRVDENMIDHIELRIVGLPNGKSRLHFGHVFKEGTTFLDHAAYHFGVTKEEAVATVKKIAEEKGLKPPPNWREPN